jgi:positive regulator of sigma E activity
MDENTRQVLVLTAEENYAHARDHEHLRAEVTAILVAAAFVLLGLALDKDLQGATLVYVSALVVIIGVLNVMLVVIHNNRFEWHVSIARAAKDQLGSVDAVSTVTKKLNLAAAWLVVASLPIVAGVWFLLIG